VVNVTREDVLAAELAQTCDLVFDLVGLQETLGQAIHLVKTGGKVVLIAAPHGRHTLELDYTEIYRRELTVLASRLYDTDFDQALPLIASGQVTPERIITHRFSLPEATAAMRMWQERRAEVIKILLEP
jgi:threonine dehydrogenase-like Zn-dependent dehydrogenase